jgi:hypothetical protein
MHRPTFTTFILLFLGAVIYHLLLNPPTLHSTPTPKFLVLASQFPTPTPTPPANPHYPTVQIEEKWRKKGRVVPKVVHYVYGLKDVVDGGKGEDFPYFAYLAVRSVLVNVKPDTIYL